MKLISVKEAYNLSYKSCRKFYDLYLNKNQSSILSKFSYGKVLFKKSKGMYLFTDDGRKILDFSGGIGVLNHGHNDEGILRTRINFQIKNNVEVHKTIFSRYTAALAHNLAQIMPKNLNKSFFCNSGAESVEGAIKAAFKYHKSNRKYVLHSDISFHGKTIAAHSLSGSLDQSLFPKVDNVISFKHNKISSLKSQIDRFKKKNGESNIYAIIIETFINSSLEECHEDFLKELFKICKKNKIIIIFDEVYTGWGKTGYLFHFFKYKNLIPDIVCMSKSMGGGKSSISAYITNSKIYSKVYENSQDAFLHTTTYNGFGEECLTALESMNIIINKKLDEKSKKSGEYIKLKLLKLKNKYPKNIKEIKGIGCLQGIILSNNLIDKAAILFNKSKTLKKKKSLLNKVPAAALSDYIFKNFGIYTVLSENKDTVIFSIAPSLIVEKKHINYFFNSLDSSLNYGIDKIIRNFILKTLIS